MAHAQGAASSAIAAPARRRSRAYAHSVLPGLGAAPTQCGRGDHRSFPTRADRRERRRQRRHCRARIVPASRRYHARGIARKPRLSLEASADGHARRGGAHARPIRYRSCFRYRSCLGGLFKSFLTSPYLACAAPAPLFAAPLTCWLVLPTALPAVSCTLPAASLTRPST